MKRFRPELENGVIIFILLASYFLTVDIFGLSDSLLLRMFNVVIVYFGVNRCIKNRIRDGNNTYLGCLGGGVLTSFIGVSLSIIGLAVYIVVFRGPEYISELAPSVISGNGAHSVFQFCVALLVEGLASSIVLSFILMQKWKNIKNIENV